MTIQSPVGAQFVVDGELLLNFGGSSYLGLAGNADILEAGVATLRECGSGMPIPAHHGIVLRAHREIEQEAQSFFATPAAQFLAGGYYFGLIGAAALRAQFEPIFFDELSHHALRDGIAASGVECFAFRHLDDDDLRLQLRRHLKPGKQPLVATDGLFSTFGEIAPLDRLLEAVAPHGGRLLVDESHSFGVLGESGRGAWEHFGLPMSSVLCGGSMGKAFGTCGGIIPASDADVEACRNTPAGMGASPGIPAAAAMCARSLKYCREHPEILYRLRANITRMKNGLRALGLDILDSPAPIAAFTSGSDASMKSLKARLLDEGIFVYHSKYIGAGAAGVIRCGIFADHTDEQIDRLLDALRRLL